MSSRTGEGDTDAQTKELLDEHQEFKEASEVYEVVCGTFFGSLSALTVVFLCFNLFCALLKVKLQV